MKLRKPYSGKRVDMGQYACLLGEEGGHWRYAVLCLGMGGDMPVFACIENVLDMQTLNKVTEVMTS